MLYPLDMFKLILLFGIFGYCCLQARAGYCGNPNSTIRICTNESLSKKIIVYIATDQVPAQQTNCSCTIQSINAPSTFNFSFTQTSKSSVNNIEFKIGRVNLNSGSGVDDLSGESALTFRRTNNEMKTIDVCFIVRIVSETNQFNITCKPSSYQKTTKHPVHTTPGQVTETTKAQPYENTKSSTDLDVIKPILVATSCVVFVAVVIVVVVVCRRRLPKKERKSNDKLKDDKEQNEGIYGMIENPMYEPSEPQRSKDTDPNVEYNYIDAEYICHQATAKQEFQSPSTGIEVHYDYSDCYLVDRHDIPKSVKELEDKSAVNMTDRRVFGTNKEMDEGTVYDHTHKIKDNNCFSVNEYQHLSPGEVRQNPVINTYQTLGSALYIEYTENAELDPDYIILKT